MKRGYVLILLFAGVLASCAAPKREAARVAPSIDYDRFKGSCTQWQSYMQTRGVQDCKGKFHPGWFGGTRCVIESTGYTFRPHRDKGWFGRTCFSVELPRNPNQFRIAQACTRIVDWVPPDPLDRACIDQRQNWLDRILAHEKLHIYQCEMEVWKANQRWRESSHKFSECGFTQRSALADLEEKVIDTLKAEQSQIMQSIDREFDSYHQTPAGQPIVIDCGACSTKR